MEGPVRGPAHSIAVAAEALAVFLLVLGLIQGASASARDGLLRRRAHKAMVGRRNDLGPLLSLSLGFRLGADVLRTARSPRWEEIGEPGAVVVIRRCSASSWSRGCGSWGAGAPGPSPACPCRISWCRGEGCAPDGALPPHPGEQPWPTSTNAPTAER
ncbi:MAG: hypothetical protein Kow0092_00310 [Deferrisomatales bacterium]